MSHRPAGPPPPEGEGGAAPEQWRASGVDVERLRALRRGEPAPEGSLDLHGRRREEVAPAMKALVRAARSRGARCVLVVHGRGAHSGDGGAVLREEVRRALSAPALAADLLAFCPAPARLGGDGATLILLRR